MRRAAPRQAPPRGAAPPADRAPLRPRRRDAGRPGVSLPSVLVSEASFQPRNASRARSGTAEGPHTALVPRWAGGRWGAGHSPLLATTHLRGLAALCLWPRARWVPGVPCASVTSWEALLFAQRSEGQCLTGLGTWHSSNQCGEGDRADKGGSRALFYW